MKKVSYSRDIAVMKRAVPLQVPADVLAEQVRASMAIEGRIVNAALTIKHTPASKQAVTDIAARSSKRRESRGGTKA